MACERLERAAANSAELNHAVQTAYPKAMFVLMPVFALLTNFAWRKKLPRYPAHLYLALHLHAAWFGAFAIVTLVGIFIASTAVRSMLGWAAVAYLLSYTLVALKRVFDESWVSTIGRSALVAVGYSLCLFVVSLAVLAYAISTM